MELIAEIFIRSWFGSAVLHVGAGLTVALHHTLDVGASEEEKYRFVPYRGEMDIRINDLLLHGSTNGLSNLRYNMDFLRLRFWIAEKIL